MGGEPVDEGESMISCFLPVPGFRLADGVARTAIGSSIFPEPLGTDDLLVSWTSNRSYLSLMIRLLLRPYEKTCFVRALSMGNITGEKKAEARRAARR